MIYPDDVLIDIGSSFSMLSWGVMEAMVKLLTENESVECTLIDLEKSLSVPAQKFRRELSFLEGAQVIKVQESAFNGRMKAVLMTENGQRLFQLYIERTR